MGAYEFDPAYVPPRNEFFKPSDHEGRIVAWWSDGTVEDHEANFGTGIETVPDTPRLPVIVTSPLTRDAQVYEDQTIVHKALRNQMAPARFAYGRIVKEGRAYTLAGVSDDERKKLAAWFKSVVDSDGMFAGLPEGDTGGHAPGEEPF